MITLAATSLHIVRHIYTEPNFTTKRVAFERRLVELTRETYGQNIEINFYIDEGGTFMKVLVGTTMLTSLLADLPDALDTAIAYGGKALEFGDQLIEDVGTYFNLSESDIDWKQRRSGDAKIIATIAKNTKKFKQGKLHPEEAVRAGEDIRQGLRRLGNKISNIQDLAPLLKDLPPGILPTIPAGPEEVQSPIVALPPRQREYYEMDACYGTGPSERPVRKERRRRIYETTLTT